MTPDYSYVYKKLDEAHLGHEEAKQWVLSNLGQVLDYIDAINNEVVRLQDALTYCEEELEDERYDERYDVGALEKEVLRLQAELETLRGKNSTGN